MNGTPTSATRPKVSVIVPVFESGWVIEEALESLRAQTLDDFEAVIVNDGSTDDGPDIARRFAAGDPRFRVIDQPNSGLSAARNAGIEAARGEFLHFLDADDRLAPLGLQHLGDRITHSGAPGVYARLDYRAVEMHPTAWSPMTDHPRVDHGTLLKGCVFPVHAQLIRRDAVGDVRFDPALRIGEDWDFWLRLSERGVWWEALDTVVGVYRMSPASLSRQPEAMLETLSRTLSAAHARAGSGARELDPVLAALCLEWATARAASGDAEAVEAAVRLLHSAPTSTEWTPREAAIKAFHRLAWMAGLTPCAWASAPEGMAIPAVGLWRAMEAAGVVDLGFTERALAELSLQIAHPEMVARACVDRAVAVGPVHLLGLGGNARYVAQECQRRNIPWTGSDDRAIDGWQPAWALAVVGEPVNLGQPVPRCAVIVTPTDDAALAAKVLEGHAVRWPRVRRDLAAAMFGRLEPALRRDEAAPMPSFQ